VCVWRGGGGGGERWKREETDAKVFICCSQVTRYREKKMDKRKDVCSVERGARLSFAGT